MLPDPKTAASNPAQQNQSGSYFATHRVYDPTTGSWTTTDPAQSPWDRLFAYSSELPVSHGDPSGLSGGYNGVPAWNPWDADSWVNKGSRPDRHYHGKPGPVNPKEWGEIGRKADSQARAAATRDIVDKAAEAIRGIARPAKPALRPDKPYVAQGGGTSTISGRQRPDGFSEALWFPCEPTTVDSRDELRRLIANTAAADGLIRRFDWGGHGGYTPVPGIRWGKANCTLVGDQV